MTWIYEGSKTSTIVKGHYGFVYEITYGDGTKYIGKKSFYTYSTLPALKNGEQRPNSKRIGKNKDGKRVYFDIVSKESNWKDYEGSNKETTGLTVIKKEILEYAKTNRYLTYLEVKYLFEYGVLETEKYRNLNINGKWFKGGLI